MDASYFETFQLAVQDDVELIILPIANMEEYSEWGAKRGIWCRAQENYFYGIKPSLNGYFAGMHFTGKAEIVAPTKLTDDNSRRFKQELCHTRRISMFVAASRGFHRCH